MTLVWSEIMKLSAWAPFDGEEHVHPNEVDGHSLRDDLDRGHINRLADSIRQHGYSPERHGQLGLNVTDSGENIYHHASGTEAHPQDTRHHEHLLHALRDVGHGEVPMHIHDQSSDPESGGGPPKYYHGTTAENLEQVHPNHSTQGNFGNNLGVHEPGYAYATSKSNAKHYAETAAMTHGGRARVYEVHPNGPVEKDPSHDAHGTSRGNFQDDVRSKHGFTVVGEEDLGHHDEEDDDWH
ncbi:NAD(+)--rifampin ADP-ribosyltransferase [Streptomyces sp. NPDC088727]|uniref:NAD(+)--rifampin ADP-ribosyltransferase n=1 Tax=Streptomyces sp. NPDC088727 TaxID=3365875 RepID=UPI00380312A2